MTSTVVTINPRSFVAYHLSIPGALRVPQQPCLSSSTPNEQDELRQARAEASPSSVQQRLLWMTHDDGRRGDAVFNTTHCVRVCVCPFRYARKVTHHAHDEITRGTVGLP